MQPAKTIKVIISGGGTGGHIYPAIAIADELRKRSSGSEILFVGAMGRMEMEKVPAAGYPIKGLPVSGFQRKLTLKNARVLFDLIRSLKISGRILMEFNPDIVIGVGGYASGPLLYRAAKKKIPCLIQEQNSYAGITNKILAKHAAKICVAYSNMEKYFPADKIVLSGNPVRNITISDKQKEEARNHFKLSGDKPVLLVLGGSLGAKTINEAVLEKLDMIVENEVQLIWQTGKIYYDSIKQKTETINKRSVEIYDFIKRMDYAYNIADLVISRAGAISISEICLTAKAAVLVPSPNVAEDHQTKNASALVRENAAVMITDKEAKEKLLPEALKLLSDKNKIRDLSANAKRLSNPHAAAGIVDEIYKLVERY